MFPKIEYGARRIYEGQLAVLRSRSGEDSARAAEKIQEMYDQEKHHFDVMDRLVLERRVRPTLLIPFWHVGAYALGAATALLGSKAAMACTVAVETEIGQHYNDQLRELHQLEEKDTELLETIAEFRDDELHHKDVALEEGAAGAPGYDFLIQAIRGVTRVAIKVAEKV